MGLRTLFHAFFASIPYEWYTNNDIANYEGLLRQRVLFVFRGVGIGHSPWRIAAATAGLDMAVLFNEPRLSV